MEIKSTKCIFEIFANSLENTQKSSTSMEMMVQSVQTLSNEGQYKLIINNILNDSTISCDKKVALIKEVDSNYETRKENNARLVMNMQATQALNISSATKCWGKNLLWLAIGIAISRAIPAIASTTKRLSSNVKM